MKQSELLTKFYGSYNDWIENGAPHNSPYNRFSGLCNNLLTFCRDGKQYHESLLEMKIQFHKAGLDDLTPFNAYMPYIDEFSKGLCHQNKLRLKWVKDHL